jgi:hypothetical protein
LNKGAYIKTLIPPYNIHNKLHKLHNLTPYETTSTRTTLTTSTLHNMPLVVPGLQSKDGSGGEDWMSKLMGKKLGDQHDEMVRSSHIIVPLPFPSCVIAILLFSVLYPSR